MFADNFNPKSNVEAKPSAPIVPVDFDTEVMWEFKWEDTQDAEVHGPHSSSKMLQWQENGFFDKGMFCRKLGSESSSFLDGKRIDFDLYV